ncbi:BnaC01g10290D [Brassica napus]|uniref:(rape) hypothetical protein n=1 Tax=Brassica napus TaxID=3708 RepID=A0A078HIY8_BRANA|nr:unnamed protein product [Brassica napus]CDY38420.1 BnaC01g10290D [Brassica napus]
MNKEGKIRQTMMNITKLQKKEGSILKIQNYSHLETSSLTHHQFCYPKRGKKSWHNIKEEIKLNYACHFHSSIGMLSCIRGFQIRNLEFPCCHHIQVKKYHMPPVSQPFILI